MDWNLSRLAAGVNPRRGFFFLTGSLCGEDGDRTRDLLLAKQALSQLSYSPQVCEADRMCAYLDSNQGPQLYQSCALAN